MMAAASRLLKWPVFVRTGIPTSLTVHHEHGCRLASVSEAPILARGKKSMKFGGFTRDPFKTFQNKLARMEAQKTAKTPLMSKERWERSLIYPLNVQSLGMGVA